jgi:hypothetical protein
VVELKVINPNFTRYPRGLATVLRVRVSVNKREQQLYPGYLAPGLLPRKIETFSSSHTRGRVRPLERGFTSITNLTDVKGWVFGFYGEWSDELAKLPTLLADAELPHGQNKHGRDPPRTNSVASD